MKRKQSGSSKDSYSKKHIDIGAIQGKQRTFGCPVDMQLFDSLLPTRNQIQGNLFTSAVLRALAEMSTQQGNPLTILLKKEAEEIDIEVKKLIEEWLPQAFGRLTIDQEICIYFRFRLDDKTNKTMRKEVEVAEIIGISQQNVSLSIIAGLKRLQKDFKKNLLPKINKLKS